MYSTSSFRMPVKRCRLRIESGTWRRARRAHELGSVKIACSFCERIGRCSMEEGVERAPKAREVARVEVVRSLLAIKCARPVAGDTLHIVCACYCSSDCGCASPFQNARQCRGCCAALRDEKRCSKGW